MQSLARVVTAIVGAMLLLVMGVIWLRAESAGLQLGLRATAVTGDATLRATVAGFFGAGGLLALGAAIRNEARYAGAVIVLLATALAGRAVDVVLRGYAQALLPSMLVEVALIALLLFAYRNLGRRDLRQ